MGAFDVIICSIFLKINSIMNFEINSKTLIFAIIIVAIIIVLTIFIAVYKNEPDNNDEVINRLN
jgi:hypothetical protein